MGSDWAFAAAEDLRSGQFSVAMVANKHRRSESAIRKLLRSENITRPGGGRAKGMRSFLDQGPLSKEHMDLGIFLTRLQGDEGQSSFADRLGTSAINLGKMQNGLYDFTLGDLQRIAKVSGRSIHALHLQFGDSGEPQGRLH